MHDERGTETSPGRMAVSYTHLDVYKRQAQCLPCFGAKGPLHDGEGGNEGQRDGDGSGKEAAQHLGTQLDDLADVCLLYTSRCV